MQVKAPRQFQIKIENTERPDLLTDLYFSRNPMHWKFEEVSLRKHNSQTFTINDQFTRIQFRVDITKDIKKYSGGVYAGVGNPPQQEFSEEFAEAFFNRINKQRSKWIKNLTNSESIEAMHHDSPEREIEGIINLRAPTDWKLTTQRADSKLKTPKITTLTSGQGGIRVQFVKYHGAAEDGQDLYVGQLSGARQEVLDPDRAKNYFEQILKCAEKSIAVDLRHLIEYELDTILENVPKESWLVSKRWLDSDEDPQQIGYSAISSVDLMEGKNSFQFNIDISVDTRYNEQVIRFNLKRNGHQASRIIPREQHAKFLDQLCSMFDLYSFHLESAEFVPDDLDTTQKDLTRA